MSKLNQSIQQLAYAMWEARGCPDGSSEVDWFAAEREVTGKHVQASGGAGAPAIDQGLGLTAPPASDLKEDGITNPHDGRGPLRDSDDLGYDQTPVPTEPNVAPTEKR